MLLDVNILQIEVHIINLFCHIQPEQKSCREMSAINS
jgi:hypothetical protein